MCVCVCACAPETGFLRHGVFSVDTREDLQLGKVRLSWLSSTRQRPIPSTVLSVTCLRNLRHCLTPSHKYFLHSSHWLPLDPKTFFPPTNYTSISPVKYFVDHYISNSTVSGSWESRGWIMLMNERINELKFYPWWHQNQGFVVLDGFLVGAPNQCLIRGTNTRVSRATPGAVSMPGTGSSLFSYFTWSQNQGLVFLS